MPSTDCPTMPTTKEHREAKTLQLFQQSLDIFVEKDTTLDALLAYSNEFSPQAGQILGQIQTLMLECWDKNAQAARSISSWCELAKVLLPVFLECKDSQSQIEILKALEDNKSSLFTAAESLRITTEHLHVIEKLLDALITQLQDDFTKKSPYYTSVVAELRKQIYLRAGMLGFSIGALSAGSTAGVAAISITGPVGLVVGISAAAVITEEATFRIEKELQIQITDHFKKVQDNFIQIRQHIITCAKNMASNYAALQSYLNDVNGTMFGELNMLTENALQTRVNDYIANCEKFIDKNKPMLNDVVKVQKYDLVDNNVVEVKAVDTM